jgi:hypothetical protein
MADKTTEVTTEVTTEATTEAPEGENVQISIEQICAAIVSSLGSVEVQLETLLTDYSSKNIAINQNEETKALTFTLVDAPVPEIQEEKTE